MNIKSTLKDLLFPKGIRPYVVMTGVFRGLKIDIDLQNASQVWMGFYERETYRWIHQFGAGCSTAIDVGAAQGELTLYLLKRTEASRVIAYDPSPEYDATFTRNLRMNGFSDDSRLVRRRQFVGNGTNGTVRLDALNGLLESPVFIKVDVDGSEVDVLEGAVGLLELMKVRLLIETHSSELERRCDSFLQRMGYQTRIVKNAIWRILLKDMRPIELNRWLVASNDANSPV
jgi:hypothetical protein